MAGVFNNPWIPFQDQMGRQGWYNQATGQTTYQMYGGYNVGGVVPTMANMQMQQMYPPQMQMPIGYMPPMQHQMQGPLASGWQTVWDRTTGRRYYYNPITGQSVWS